MMDKQCSCNAYYTCKEHRIRTHYTHAEIGAIMGISRQMVQHIEKQAIKKFKTRLRWLGYNSIEEVL